MTPTATARVATALAGLVVAGSLYLSMGMGLAACPLCYYQRTFVMGAFAVLLVGSIGGAETKVSLPGLALPLALAGLWLGTWHVRLELAGKMECPAGIFAVGTAPQQALVAQALLVAFLLAGALRGELPGSGWLSAGVSLILAVVLAVACVASAASPPKPPLKDYEVPPAMCRPLPKPEA